MSFGAASSNWSTGVELLKGIGGLPAYPTSSNSEYRTWNPGSETAGDKLRSREGNNPDRRLRSLIGAQWKRKWACPDSQDVGLEAATI